MRDWEHGGTVVRFPNTITKYPQLVFDCSMKTRHVAQDEEHGEKKSLEMTSIPIRSGEVGVCAEFSNNNIYTLSANNKAKDREQIRYTKALVLIMGKGHTVKAGKEYKPETVLVDISKKCNAIRMESQCKYIVAIQGWVCVVLNSTQSLEMMLGIMYDEKFKRRIRIDTQVGGTSSTLTVSAMETVELYQGVQYSALIVDEIILNVVVTTRSVGVQWMVISSSSSRSGRTRSFGMASLK
jgi:hypothetical protein